MSRLVGRLCAAAGLIALAACTQVQRVEGLGAKVSGSKDAYVSGVIAALEGPAVLDNKDFVYAIALSPSGTRAAFSHLALDKAYKVTIYELGGEAPAKLAAAKLNDYEFDVEGLDFSPDGKLIAAAGRDGAVRIFDVASGTRQMEFFAEEPLTSVAFLQDGEHLVAGSASGLLILLTRGGAYASELRAHHDEVRSVAGTANGRVVSGSWDKSVGVFETVMAPVAVDELSLAVGTLKGPLNTQIVRAGLDGRAGLFAFEASAPHVVVTSELARLAGIQPNLLTDTATVDGQQVKVARGRSIQLKQRKIDNIDVAICDVCVPKGAHGVLGAPVLGLFDIRASVATGHILLSAKEKQDPSTLPQTLSLREVKRHIFDSFVNDLSVDRAGARAGVALSKDKAQRNRQVYEREKKGLPAPESDEDVAAILDLETGATVAKWDPHVGVVSTAGISPDGKSVASGGWDKKLFVFQEGKKEPVAQDEFGWSLRRVRFSRDGLKLAVGAWTPQKAVGSMESDPSAVVYDVAYASGEVVAPSTR